ncbi:MAG TPA: ATP-binding protein [Chloroflexia bacterium]|nr:ATP-binding protein [Chloroflexia bacterium]
MDWLQLSHQALNYLPSVVMLLVITGYLLSSPHKSRSTWLLGGYLAMLTLNSLGFFLRWAVYAPLSAYTEILTTGSLFLSFVFLIQFAYAFPRPHDRWESRIVLVISAGLALVYLGYRVAVALVSEPLVQASTDRFQLYYLLGANPTVDQVVQTIASGTPWFTNLSYLWAIVVLFRQAVRLSEERGPAAGLRGRLGRLLGTLVRPIGREARAAQAFGLFVIALMIMSATFAGPSGLFASLLPAIATLLPTGTYQSLLLLINLVFALVYIDNSPEPSSFRVKLVGMSLVTILVALGLVSTSTLDLQETAYDQQRLAEVANVQNLLQTGKLTNVPPAVAYIASRPLAGGTYAASYTPVYTHDTQFRAQNLIANDAQFKAYFTTWNAVALIRQKPDLTVADARKQAAAALEKKAPVQGKRSYRSGYSIPTPYVTYSFAVSPTLYEVGYSYPAYRSFIEQTTDPLALYILGATGLILLIFPLFFGASLVRPLNKLRDGVTRVNAGDLSVVVPVQVEDEIGFLSRSFNGMVASLHTANEKLQSYADDLRAANEQLQVYATDLQTKNEELKQLDKLKDDFLANTSHELRTPLNGIIGIAESLIDGVAGPLNPGQLQNLSLVASSGRRLSSLVNDILDFSKMREHDLVLQSKPLNMYRLADEVLTLSRALLGGKPVELRNEIDPAVPAVEADENRVQQILYNLVGNGVKFTAQGSVTLTAAVADGRLAITVADTGIGIPADKLDRIFGAFEQADGSTAREYGGTGLGLAVTKQLVELHGGQVLVESTPGQGSRFTFTLPLSDGVAAPVSVGPADQQVAKIRDLEPVLGPTRELVVAAEAAPAETPTRAAAPAATTVAVAVAPAPAAPDGADDMFNILVVDDEPVNLQVLANHLALQRYTVTQASNGPEALAAISNGLKPDLVLLDIMMPRMSGYEVCERLRESFPPNELPVIMLTAKNQVADLVEGFGSGANDYLTKPFSKTELLARMQTHLRLAKINVAYGRFVPTEFLHLLGQESIVDVRLGDQVQLEMTVLFADIRAFNTLSARMSPEENFLFLNSYLSQVSPVIREYGGFIDKYIGDTIMALFPRGVDQALQAAVAMRQAVIRFNARRRAAGQPTIRVGIGLHTGRLMLGTVGESARMDSTVVSAAVNTAARLEALTARYDAGLIISEASVRGLATPEAYALRSLGFVQTTGKQDTLTIYEVLDGEGAEIRARKAQTKAVFEAGLQSYQNGAFADACERFTEVIRANPADGPARLFMQRAATLWAQGAPADWSGAEILEAEE